MQDLLGKVADSSVFAMPFSSCCIKDDTNFQEERLDYTLGVQHQPFRFQKKEIISVIGAI